MNIEPCDTASADLEETALDWILRIHHSEPCAQTWAEANTWLQADPRHVEAYQRMKEFWDRIGSALAAENGLPLPKQPTRS
jgi:ferric-dicitrate binding protein FerR (iron transport regulator)